MPIPARPTRQSLICGATGFGVGSSTGMTSLGATGLEWEARFHDWTSAADVQYVISDDIGLIQLNAAGTIITAGRRGGSTVSLNISGWTDVVVRLRLDNSDATSSNRHIGLEAWNTSTGEYRFSGSTGTLGGTFSWPTGNGFAVGALYFSTGLQRFTGRVAFARCKEGLSPCGTRPKDEAPPASTYLYAFEFEGGGTDSSGNSRNLTMTGATYANSPAALPAVSLSSGSDRKHYVGDTVSAYADVRNGDGYTLTYAWTVQSGSATLSNATTSTVSFTAAAAGAVVLRCTVTVSDGVASDTLTDDVTITVLGAGTACPIMFLGDSITRGNSDPNVNGFRSGVDTGLTAASFPHDFVGSQSDGTFTDKQHEGHGGYTAAEYIAVLGGLGTGTSLESQIETYLAANPPARIVLMIGMNDCTGTVGDAAAIGVCAFYEKLIKLVPSIRVYACLITLRTDGNAARATACNVRLTTYVARLVARGYLWTLVNTDTVLVSGDIADSIHPNVTGYAKLDDPITAAILTHSLPTATRTLTVDAPSGELSDGGTDLFGAVNEDSATSRTYTLTNIGNANLTLGTITVGSGLTKTTDPSGQVIAPGGSATLALSVSTATAGAFSVSVSVPSDDTATPFDWTVSGSVVEPPGTPHPSRVWRVNGRGGPYAENVLAMKVDASEIFGLDLTAVLSDGDFIESATADTLTGLGAFTPAVNLSTFQNHRLDTVEAARGVVFRLAPTVAGTYSVLLTLTLYSGQTIPVRCDLRVKA